MARYSRRQTIEEKKNLRKAFLYIFLTLIGIAVMFFFGITAIAKMAGFIIDFRGSSEIISSEDTTPPPPPTFENIPEHTNDYDLALTGKAEEGSTLVIIINGEAEEAIVGNNGEFTFSTQLLDGENKVSAYSVDEAGNESTKSQEYLIIYDDEPPKLEISSPADNSEFFGASQRQVSITGTTDAEAEVQINGRVVIVNQSGAFSYTLTLAEGENKFEIIASDRAGNTSKSNLTLKFSL